MNCEEVKKLLPLFLDGLDNIDKGNEIKKHLNSCNSCLKEYNLIKGIRENLSSVKDVELPEGFHEDICKKLASQPIKRRYTLASILKYAAMLAIGFMLGVLILNMPNMTGNKSTSIAPGGISTGLVNGPRYGETGGVSKSEIAQSQNSVSAGNPDHKADYDTGSKEQNAISVKAQNSKIGTGGKKIIKNASIDLKVKNLDEAYDSAVSLSEQIGGYIERSNIINGDTRSANLIVRVPQDKLTEYVEKMKKMGTVANNSMSGNDITQEYLDISSRVKSMEVERDRLQKIMDKANTVEDILKVEEQLNRVNTEIDSLKTQIKNWDLLTQNSTVSIRLVEQKPEKVKRFSVGNVISDTRDAFIKSINFLLQVISKLIILIGYILVPSIILIIVYVIYRRFKNRK